MSSNMPVPRAANTPVPVQSGATPLDLAATESNPTAWTSAAAPIVAAVRTSGWAPDPGRELCAFVSRARTRRVVEGATVRYQSSQQFWVADRGALLVVEATQPLEPTDTTNRRFRATAPWQLDLRRHRVLSSTTTRTSMRSRPLAPTGRTAAGTSPPAAADPTSVIPDALIAELRAAGIGHDNISCGVLRVEEGGLLSEELRVTGANGTTAVVAAARRTAHNGATGPDAALASADWDVTTWVLNIAPAERRSVTAAARAALGSASRGAIERR